MRVTLKQWWVTVMECRNGLLSLLQTLRELNVKTESWKNGIKNTKKWASCDENVGSLSISWSLCGRSVRARVCQVVAAPWPSASPQRPVMTSQKWGRRLRVAGTCAWTCSWRNHPGPTVGQSNWCENDANAAWRLQDSYQWRQHFWGQRWLSLPFPHGLRSGCWTWWRWRLPERSLARQLWTGMSHRGPWYFQPHLKAQPKCE